VSVVSGEWTLICRHSDRRYSETILIVSYSERWGVSSSERC